jgi:hypothetical protein
MEFKDHWLFRRRRERSPTVPMVKSPSEAGSGTLVTVKPFAAAKASNAT